MSLLPSTYLGRYEIIEPLGSGGMGEVFRGRDTMLDRAVAMQARRVLEDGIVDESESLDEILVEDIPDALTAGGVVDLPDDPIAEIDRLIGLDLVRREVRLLVAEAKAEQMRRDAGIPIGSPARHMVFTGNPGTAKTTIARLIAAVYAKLGLLSSGHLVEVGRVRPGPRHPGARSVPGPVRPMQDGDLPFLDLRRGAEPLGRAFT